LLYVNGQLDATGTITDNPDTIDTLYIGSRRYSGANDRFFNGQIDEVRIWNAARSATDIQNNMMKDVTCQSGLVAYYNFDEGTAGGTNTGLTTAIDSTGTNNGTLTNFALTGASSNWVASSAFNIWTGATNTSWLTATNWSRGVIPSFSAPYDNVLIPAGTPNQMTGGAPPFGTLVIDPGAVVTVDIINSYGNVFNNGTISASYFYSYGNPTTVRMTGAFSGSIYVQPGSILNLASDLTVTGFLFMYAGTTLNANNYNITMTGSGPAAYWYNSYGTFIPGTGTVTFSGGTNQQIGGDNTFYNLVKTTATADTLKFTAGSTQTIAGL